MYTTLLPIHIIAALIALASGAVALYATKGSTLHRKSGRVFAIAMLVMTSAAVVLATWIVPNRGNVVAGLLTFYLVCTGVLAVRRPVDQTRRLLTGLMLGALTLGAFAYAFGFEARHNAKGVLDQIPAPVYFMFGTVALLGAILDARTLLAGNIQGAHRLARHLWRMSYAMWIATTSAFLGQSKFFPQALRESGVLAIPVVLVLVVMFYWLGRLLIKRRSAA